MFVGFATLVSLVGVLLRLYDRDPGITSRGGTMRRHPGIEIGEGRR
jgi:hypothetical protein